MANIIVPKNPNRNKNPFDQSDRDPIGRHAGKGDRNRSNAAVLHKRWPRNMKKTVKGLRKVGLNRYRKTYS